MWIKFSSPEAAEFPAMTAEPKEFTADWIITLAMEKMMPWMPAERPIFNMSAALTG